MINDPQNLSPKNARLRPNRVTIYAWGLALLLVALTQVLVSFLRQQERMELDVITRVTGRQIAQQLEAWFEERKAVLLDVASRNPGLKDEAAYRQEARSFLTWFPGFQAISWVDAEGIARLVEPSAGNEQVIGFNLRQHADLSVPAAMDLAEASRLPTRSAMLQLKQGGLGFGTYTPIFDAGDVLQGFINGVFRLEYSLATCLEGGDLPRDFSLVIQESGREVYRLGEVLDDVPGHRFKVPLFDRPVELCISPSADLRDRNHGREASIILTIGLIASALAGLAMHLRLSQRLQLRLSEVRRLRLERELQQARKMESIGRLAGGIAHDFNNYLTAILGCGELLLSGLGKDDKNRPYAELGLEAGKKAASVTRQLLTFAHKQGIEHRVIVPSRLIRSSVVLLQQSLGDDIEITLELEEGLLAVVMDPVQLDQVLLNLALNARDAMPDGGTLRIETGRADAARIASAKLDLDLSTEYMFMAVLDNGSGMTEEESQMIFEPFFSTKEKGHGTGLGLSTCYGIIKHSGGLIEVQSKPGSGTCFCIYLPVTDAAPDLDVRPDPPARAANSPGGHVLLVEDEPLVRAVAESELLKAGYAVRTARDGREALELVQRERLHVDLLISDWVMPRLGGRDLANALKQRLPGLSVVFISGCADIECNGDEFYLPKPFEIGNLLQVVASRI